MKIAHRFSFVLFICMLLFGCGDKMAGIEGKIIDGKGQPLSGVSVIFRQVQLNKGYEHFETKTGPDGSFHLTGVSPSSDYAITLLSDKWSTRVNRKIKTLKAGENLVLSTPIQIRFKQQIKDGTVIDTKTGMQWLIYPVSDITATNVINTVKGIKEAGFTDWRLPSKKEMTDLQENPALVKKICCVWVAEANSEIVEWNSYMEEDNDLWTSRKESPDNRIVVVRNATPSPLTAPVAPVAKP
jgi:hypothetical protein